MKADKIRAATTGYLLRAGLIALSLLGLLANSCKDELIFPETTTEQQLQAGSNVANLMMRIAMKDGSADDFIDGASCISLKFPVTLLINGQEFVVQGEGEYALIRGKMDASGEDAPRPQIVFPVDIQLADHSTVSLSGPRDLAAHARACESEGGADPDIECLDFKFPLILSERNLISGRLESFSVQNDQALFELLSRQESGNLLSMEFPVAVLLDDGTQAVLSDLPELEGFILGNRDSCPEGDHLYEPVVDLDTGGPEDDTEDEGADENGDEDDDEGDDDDDEDDDDDDDDDDD